MVAESAPSANLLSYPCCNSNLLMMNMQGGHAHIIIYFGNPNYNTHLADGKRILELATCSRV